MPIPDYQTLMLPLLKLVAEGDCRIRDAVPKLADEFELTEAEREELLPSGRQATMANRTHWASTYLVNAKLLDRPKRGTLTITPRGRELLLEHPVKINVGLLDRYPEFRSFRSVKKDSNLNEQDIPSVADPDSKTPEERIDAAHAEMEAALREDILDRIQNGTPVFFEQLIVDLMLAMGYGKSGTGERVGRSNDGGVDGIISEDALGLDLVFLQAKRYQEGSVIGSEKIQAFVGSLVGQGANKGVFVTTSHFSKQAKDFADRTPQRIILIDGEELTQLCVRYGVGVKTYRGYALMRIDFDYFDGDDI